MGIIRSRWTNEVNEESDSQDSCHEVEKPLLKKRCLPFIGTAESEKDGEETESESESDSGDEEEEESTSVGDTDNTDNEEEEDDSSESESENGSERSHEEEALHLGRKEEQRKTMEVVRSIAAIEEENEESESQESDSEVEQPLVKQSCLPSVDIPQCNKEDEQSLVKHSCVPAIDTPQCNKEEDDEDVKESESESDSDSDMQTTVANEEYVSKNHKQTVVVNEKEEGNTSKSESEGDSEGSNEHEALDFGEKEEQGKTIGIIRSRWTIEVNEESDSQDSCHEVEKPLLKKRCLPFIGTTESEKDGEELESESESDSGDEEEEESTSVGDTDNTDKEEEEDDSSESESENGTERSHEEEVLDLGRKEEQGKTMEVVRSIAAIEEENEEFESQESDSEVEQLLVKQSCLPSVHNPQCNKEKEQSLVKHSCVPSIDTPQCNKEEDDEAIEESESDSDSGKETESSSSRDTNSNHMQTTVANEKYARKSHKQTVVENEKEEGDLSKSESEGDSVGNNEHETLDFEEKEEQGKTMGIIQSRWTIEANEESDSQDSCHEVEKPLLKKRCLPFIDTTKDENPLLKKRCLPFIDTTEAEKDGEESDPEFESESDSGEEEESSSVGDTDNNDKHTLLINEEEEDDSSESESENGTKRRNEEEALDLGRKEEQGKVVRSRAAIEEENEESESQESDSEVEQPLVKQSCPPSVHIPQCNKEKEQSLVKHSCIPSIDTPQCSKEEDDEAIEESESDSDSGKETESSSSRNTNSNHMQTTVANEKYVRKNHKQTVVENEKEEGDLSKSESEGDSEGNNEHETLDFKEKEEQGKTIGIIRSRWTIEVNEESDSQDSCHEVEKPLLKKRCLPFIGTTESEKDGEELESESESDSGDEEEEESSSVGDTDNTDKEEEEDDSSESESENGTERSHEEEALDLGRKEEQGKTMEVVRSIAAIEEENEEFESQESDSEVEQPLVKQSCLPSVHIPQCNKEEDDEAMEDSGEEKESSSSRDTDSNHMQTTVANGEYVSKNHKQTMAENEIEEGDLSKSESEGDSEGSNEHRALDFGEKEEQGKVIGVIHSKAAIATNVESESEKSLEVKQLSVKKSEVEESEVDSEEEEESSSLVYTSNNHKQNMVVEEEENDSSESESEGDSEESNGHEDLDIGDEDDQGNVTQSEYWMRMSQKKTKSFVSPKSYQADAMASETVSKSIADKKPLKANEGRNLYHRWSDDGVINLLEGMIEVKDRVSTGKSYISALCDIIGESSDFQHRAREKLRRLKALYKKNVGKPFKNFTSHEKRVFELSKIVWGIELGPKLSIENYNAKQSQHCQSNKILMGDHCSQARKVLKNGFGIIERFQSKSAFDERWIKLRLQEIQLYQEKLAIVKGYLDGVVDELHASLRSLQEAQAD